MKNVLRLVLNVQYKGGKRRFKVFQTGLHSANQV